jgi:hypothetical protein
MKPFELAVNDRIGVEPPDRVALCIRFADDPP